MTELDLPTPEQTSIEELVDFIKTGDSDKLNVILVSDLLRMAGSYIGEEIVALGGGNFIKTEQYHAIVLKATAVAVARSVRDGIIAAQEQRT